MDPLLVDVSLQALLLVGVSVHVVQRRRRSKLDVQLCPLRPHAACCAPRPPFTRQTVQILWAWL